MRARGALVELRARDLAFTLDEAQELLVERGGVELERDEVAVLCERTEGWPAALFLALLWLRRVDDPRHAVRGFGGDHRFVVEYLSREVLAGLDDDVRSFLLSASVLGRFTPQLADDVLGRSDSAAVLRELERSNLFVYPLDSGGWFRIHPLFAEFARIQLVSAEPDAASEIHRAASRSLSASGLVVEAAEHAAAAGDEQLLARVLSESHLTLVRSGEARTVLRLARSLSEDSFLDHPELAAVAALATAIVGGAAVERRRYLALVDRVDRGSRPGLSAYARAVAFTVRAAAVDDDVTLAVDAGREAVRIAEVEADDVLLASRGGLARALYFAGELDEAWATGIRAIEHPDARRRPPGLAFASSTLALVAAERGHLRSARQHAETARMLLADVGRSWLGANASAALGVVLAAEGDLSAAERELGRAVTFFRDELATVHEAWLHLSLARVACRRGRLERAEAALRSAREELAELVDAGRLAALAEAVALELEEARARARAGELLEPPTEAELAVLRLLDSDLSTRGIAGTLFLSPNTVRSHTRALYRKLGVGSRVDAVARATELGLLGETESPG
jgi:LuxR family maltose regulon positive regulatory protein